MWINNTLELAHKSDCLWVAPALAAGCTLILKPSEVAPLSSVIFTEILHDAGLPKGVFNLIHGGSNIGIGMSEHPSIDMISFTGSTKAGISVAKNSANTVKRVTQELEESQQTLY